MSELINALSFLIAVVGAIAVLAHMAQTFRLSVLLEHDAEMQRRAEHAERMAQADAEHAERMAQYAAEHAERMAGYDATALLWTVPSRGEVTRR